MLDFTSVKSPTKSVQRPVARSSGHDEYVTFPLILQQNGGITLSMGHKMEKSYVVKMVKYYSGTASMVTHTNNPGMHVCPRGSQNLK